MTSARAIVSWVMKANAGTCTGTIIASPSSARRRRSMGSVVFQEVRESRALAYTVFTNYRAASRADIRNG